MKKINLIYFKHLVDFAFIRFFDEYNNCFVHQNNCYFLKRQIPKKKLHDTLMSYIIDEIKKHTTPYDVLDLKRYVIIGSCFPKDNILLRYKDNTYFPKKLDKLLSSEYQIKYLIKETDIKLNIVEINSIIIDIFNELFDNKKHNFLRNKYKNVIFIQHRQLDCYVMFKIIKSLYGKNNCYNIFKHSISENLKRLSPLIAVNELIDKYIHNKLMLRTDTEYLDIVSEIDQYLKMKFSSFLA